MAVEFEDLNLTLTDKDCTVSCESESVSFSHQFSRIRRFQDSILVSFGSEANAESKSDVTIPYSQNVARINADCIVEWFVERHTDSPDTHQFHVQVYVLNDERIVTKTEDLHAGDLHEIDPSTGEILHTWSRSEFGFGQTHVTFDSRIYAIDSYRDSVFIETLDGIHAFDKDGTRLWFRPISSDDADGPSPFGTRASYFKEKTYVIHSDTRGRQPTHPALEIELDTGRIVEASQMSQKRANKYIDFDTVGEWLPARTRFSIVVFDERGDVVWEQSFDEELLDAATAGRVTVVETDAPDDESSPVSLRGFDADGTRLWERHATTEVTVLPAEDTIHLLVSDTEAVDGDKCTVELDPETGAITAVVSGNESVADKLLE